MGKAMEIITGRAANPASYTAVTMATGDSATVRNFPTPGTAKFLQTWALGATKGNLRVRSARLHDNVQGIKASFAAAAPNVLLDEHFVQNLYAQDNLTIEIIDAGTETDMLSMLMYYSDLPGTDARLYTWDEIAPRVIDYMGTEVDITTGGTAGDYGGATAINATFDQFKANQDYAILGYVTDTAMCSVGIRSADFGNLRVGGPGTNAKIETRNWFTRLSDVYRMPCIPVFNAANKSNTLVDVVHNATSTAVTVTLLCAHLST
jgi:hypothetical protein